MATQTVQQVVDYLKANPDVARKALDYVKAHPDEVKEALKEVAEERGWDLSKIDTAALKAEIGKIAH
jgi:tagatose-1,6-bisphosphate aldolase